MSFNVQLHIRRRPRMFVLDAQFIFHKAVPLDPVVRIAGETVEHVPRHEDALERMRRTSCQAFRWWGLADRDSMMAE